MQIGQVESSPHLPTLDALDAEFRWDDKQYALRTGESLGLRSTTTGPSPDSIINPSLGRRASRGLARLLVVFCSGVTATLTWQLYGDAARAMIAKSSPQLGWLAPQTAPVAQTAALPQTAPEVVAPTAAASPDLQPFVLGLASVHQSIDQLAAQLAADQRQTGGDIAKLQEILHKLLATPLRPAAAPTPKPSPVTPPPLPSGPAR